MKKVKVIFWLLVVGFVALVVYQNKGYFLAQESLNINLYVAQYHTPQIATGILILSCFVVGFLIAYLMSLSERFKARKAVKTMEAAMKSQMEQISELKSEVENLKRREPVAAQEPSDEASEPPREG